MYGGNVILSKYQNTKTYDRRPKTYNNIHCLISSSVKDVETFNLYNSLHVHHEIF